MEIVVLPRSTSGRVFLPRPSLFTVYDDNLTAKNLHSNIQSRRRGGPIAIYWGATSSSGTKWISHRNINPPTVNSGKYIITSCGLQISDFIKSKRGRAGQLNTPALSVSVCRDL